MATNTIAINVSEYREDLIRRLNILKFILIGNVDYETRENVDILIDTAETSTTIIKLKNINKRAKNIYEYYKFCTLTGNT